jgi:hypothetical protein
LLAQSGPGLTKTDRDAALSMLHTIEQDIRRNYYDPAWHGVDLGARAREAELRIRTTTGFNDAVATLSEFVGRLDDSHTTFIPPSRRTRVAYGWRMAIVGGVPLVVSVEDASDAAVQGMAAGDRVLLLNGLEPTLATLSRLEYFYRFIRPQVLQHVSVLKPNGAALNLDIRSRVEDQAIVQLDDLIGDMADALNRSRDVSTPAGPDTLAWKMTAFLSADRVDEAIGKALGYKTLVLDLRGNGGGAVTALRELVSRTFDRDVLVATETRRGKEVKEIAKPARRPFTGRLIVLVDSRSASAAEMFARIVQLEKRGTVLGDRTAGAVMTSRMFPHAIGNGAVSFYATSITIGDVRMSDGMSLEKIGVQPDEIVLPRPSDLAAGRDPVLARAIALAGGVLSPDEAGRLFK